MVIKIKKFKQSVETSWGELQRKMDIAEQSLIGEINDWKGKHSNITIVSITPLRNAHMGDFCEERYVELTVVYDEN